MQPKKGGELFMRIRDLEVKLERTGKEVKVIRLNMKKLATALESQNNTLNRLLNAVEKEVRDAHEKEWEDINT